MAAERPLYALFLRLFSAFSFGALLLVVKLAQETGIQLPEIMFWRQAGVVVLVALWLVWLGQLGQLRTRRPGGHALRAVFGMTNMALNFGSTILLPLAAATVFGFTTPIFAVIIAALFLREHVGPWRWAAVLLGFIGVVIVAQPGGEALSPLGTAMALATGVTMSLINFQIRSLGATESSYTIVFWFSAIGALIMAPFLPFTMTGHDAYQWLLIALLGILGTAGQMSMTASLRHGQLTSVLVMDYTMLFWSILFDWLFWNHFPAWTTWLGSPLIVAAGLTIALREQRLVRRTSPVAAARMD
jgi:drug/metabolite transporter (DMT)-like permease